MRVLFQYFTGGGGALSNIILLLQALSKEYPKDNYDIVCSDTSDLHSLSSYPNIKVVSYGVTGISELDRAFLGFGGLNDIAAKQKADIVWSLNLGSYTRSEVPQILSVNNPHQVYPWKVTKYHPDNSVIVAFLRWFFRKTLSASDAVIVQTPIMGQYVKALKSAPKDVFVVPKAVENEGDVLFEGIPENIKREIDGGMGRNTFTYLYVSTYTPHKNHKVLIDAFDMLLARGVRVRVILTLSDSELMDKYGEKAKRLIEYGCVIPVGWIRKNYLRSLYDISDACLMPSVLESLSSAHLEAMKWGKPQIVADLPYSRDLCGLAAIYVSAENPEAWAMSINELMSDSELRSKLVESGYNQMKKYPETWSEMACKVHEVFDRVLCNKKMVTSSVYDVKVFGVDVE